MEKQWWEQTQQSNDDIFVRQCWNILVVPQNLVGPEPMAVVV